MLKKKDDFPARVFAGKEKSHIFAAS